MSLKESYKLFDELASRGTRKESNQVYNFKV